MPFAEQESENSLHVGHKFESLNPLELKSSADWQHSERKNRGWG